MKFKIICVGKPTLRFRATAVGPVTLSWLLRQAAAEPVCRETVLDPGEHVIIVGREEPEEIRLSMPLSPRSAQEDAEDAMRPK